MKRKIRRVFENITPNVLKNILSQINDMQEPVQKPKKIIEWKKYIATAAAVLLLFGVGYGGAAILSGQGVNFGASKPQIPTADMSMYISEKEATDIALANMYANEKRDILNVTDARAKFNDADDRAYYDVVLRFEDTMYAYDIDAASGLIQRIRVEKSRDSMLSGYLSWLSARDAALAHADISIETLTHLEISFDEGECIYEIEFRDQVFEYDYEIDGYDGKVLSCLLDNDDDEDPALSVYRPRQYSVKTALAYAGVSYEELYFLESASDYTSSPKTRTVNFLANDTTYEFTLYMDSHTILRSNIYTPGAEIITQKEALRAALSLSHMPILTDEISDISIDLNFTDDIPVYEIEIKANGIEYEAVVDAVTGKLFKLEKESEDFDTPTFGYTNIALSSANVEKLDLTYLETEYNEKKDCYEVTFTKDDVTNTIEVFEKVKDPQTPSADPTDPPATTDPAEPTDPPVTNAPPENVVVPDKNIGSEGAIKAALADLKIDRSDIMYESVELEKDDGVTYYEVKFLYKGFIYECEVHCVSGKVRDWDKEEFEAEDDELKLSKSLDREIRQAFFNTYVGDSEKAYHSIDDLTVKYYGEYDECHVVMVDGIVGYDTAITKQQVCGIEFTYPTSQQLLAYEDGKFMNLEQAYDRDILDYEDIVYLHMNYT